MFCPKCGNEGEDTSRFCASCGAELPRIVPGQGAPQFQSPARTSVQAPGPGSVIDGRYRIEAKIGTGGMGDVYRATRLLLGDTVALKILKSHLSSDPNAAERFRREAITASRLRHRNVVGIYDVGVIHASGTPFILMELAQGISLRHILAQRGTLPIDFVASIVSQVCAGLSEAHSLRIVHRDIKPENIMAHRDENGWKIKVLDFGIAKLYNQENTSLTLDGTSIGTPNYMSPEQCLGEALDNRSDLYSLAVVVYEMLTGRVPFSSQSMSAVVVHHVHTPPPPPSSLNPAIHPNVEAVILRALAKKREERFISADEFSSAFLAAAKESSEAGQSSVDPSPTVEEEIGQAGFSGNSLESRIQDDMSGEVVPAVTTPAEVSAPDTSGDAADHGEIASEIPAAAPSFSEAPESWSMTHDAAAEQEESLAETVPSLEKVQVAEEVEVQIEAVEPEVHVPESDESEGENLESASEKEAATASEEVESVERGEELPETDEFAGIHLAETVVSEAVLEEEASTSEIQEEVSLEDVIVTREYVSGEIKENMVSAEHLSAETDGPETLVSKAVREAEPVDGREEEEFTAAEPDVSEEESDLPEEDDLDGPLERESKELPVAASGSDGFLSGSLVASVVSKRNVTGIGVGAVLLLVAAIALVVFSTSGGDSAKTGGGSSKASASASQGAPPGMAFIPAGEFTLGDDGEMYSRPSRKVKMKAFYMDIYEVTNEDYKKFVDATRRRPPEGWSGRNFPKGEAKYPVGVRWADADAYAKWAGKRLPTEEEWEYAARGTDDRKYPWGNEWDSTLANVDGSGLAEVGKFGGKSPFGLFDLIGNAWEWTSIDSGPYPSGEDFQLTKADFKIIRGGGYKSYKEAVSVYHRRPYRKRNAEAGYRAMGFRCAKDLP